MNAPCALLEYEDAPDVVAAPLPGEFTTAEKVERDREVRRLTERAKEAEAKYAEAMRGGEVEDRIVDAMEKRIPTLAPVHTPTLAKRSGGKPETAVALVSDYHIGEVVSIGVPSTRTPTPRPTSSWTTSSPLTTLRARRSSFVTTSVSPALSHARHASN